MGVVKAKKVKPMFTKAKEPRVVPVPLEADKKPDYSFKFSTPSKEVVRINPDGTIMIYSSKHDSVVPLSQLELESDAESAARVFYKVLRELSEGSLKQYGKAKVAGPSKRSR